MFSRSVRNSFSFAGKRFGNIKPFKTTIPKRWQHVEQKINRPTSKEMAEHIPKDIFYVPTKHKEAVIRKI